MKKTANGSWNAIGLPLAFQPLAQMLRMMRLPSLFLLITFLSTFAVGSAQQITFSGREVPLKKIFTVIEKQTGYTVFTSKTLLAETKPVTVSVQGIALKQFLDIIFQGQNLTYKIEDRNIFLDRKSPAGSPGMLGGAGTVALKTVRIKVVDENDHALSGATVMSKNSKVSGVTDREGFFGMNVTDGDVLLISYVGFKTRELTIKGNNPLLVKLNRIKGTMDTSVIVSTGYQEFAKDRATGSFVQINNELLNRSVSTNVLDRIYNITNSLRLDPGTSGGTGRNGSNVTIRGFSTISANKKPLIVVDGFPYEEGDGETSRLLLDNMNPNDVESITILRDAAAASIWGARSGNGVIVINTKKGKYNQKAKVDLNVSMNITEKPNLFSLPLVSSADIVEYERRKFATGIYNQYDDLYPDLDYFPALSPVVELLLAQRKGLLSKEETEAKLAVLANHDVRTDISKYLLRDAVNQQYNLNVSGGSGSYKYYTSVGLDKNMQQTKRDDYTRFTLRLENSFKPVKQLELNAYIVYTQNQNNNNGLIYNNFINNMGIPLYTMLADDQGNALPTMYPSWGYRQPYIDTVNFPGMLDWNYRPLEELANNDNTLKSFSTRLGGGIRYSVLPGISIEGKGQYERTSGSNDNYFSMNTYMVRDAINRFVYQDATGKLQYPVPLGAILESYNSIRVSWNMRGQLNLNKNWQRHQVNALAGIEASEASYESNSSRRYGFDPETYAYATNLDHNTVFPNRPLGNYGSNNRVSYGSTLRVNRLSRQVSYYSNAGYTLDDKYTFTASARIDGSNFFGIKFNQKLTPLWSAGLAWNIARERFFKSNWLSFLNARITYGFNGNMDNSATALPTYFVYVSSGSYHGERYLQLRTPPNPGLSWERVKMVNIAMDFRTTNNRWAGGIEYYTKHGIDLIGARTIENTVGISSYTANYASMKGKGIDFTFNSININRRIQWQSNLMVSYNTDEVTDYRQTSTSASLYLIDGFMVEGKPLSKIYAYPFAGLDPANGNPLGYIDGRIEPFGKVLTANRIEDLKYVGTRTPRVFGSLLNNVRYKQFSLSANIRFNFDYYFRRNSIDYNNLESLSGHADYALRWKQPGDEKHTNIYSLPTPLDNRYNFFRNSEAVLERADHIRLQDIRLAYSFNRLAKRKFPFNEAQLSVYVNNIGVLWTANDNGDDPDSANGFDIPRSIAVSLNIHF